jgi:hypothetical protein
MLLKYVTDQKNILKQNCYLNDLSEPRLIFYEPKENELDTLGAGDCGVDGYFIL